MTDKIIIGIDPDVNKSGIAVVRGGDIMCILNFKLWEVFQFLYSYNSTEDFNMIVVIEAGWIDKNDNEAKNKSYHGGGKGSSYDVGRNSEIGRQIAIFCKDNGIEYVLRQPRGYSKMYADVFAQITGYKGRTNSETRVAAMFALDEWNLINLQSKTKAK